MKKKTKKLLKNGGIIGAIFLLLVVGIFVYNSNNQPSIPTDTLTTPPLNGGSSGGSDTPTEEGWSFPDFSGLFDWDIPCLWNCNEPEVPEEPTPFICYKNADCSNVCSDPADAICSNGECSCVQQPVTIPKCLDTDVALASRTLNVYEIKGSCYEDGFIDSRGLTDYCSRGLLVEYSCRTDTACFATTIDCSKQLGDIYASCYNGECVTLA